MKRVSTYLYWLAEKAHHGIEVKAEKDLVYKSLPFLSLVWPELSDWKNHKECERALRETRVLRLLLAANIAEDAGE